MVKKFLDERAVPYRLRNVSTEEDAVQEFLALGGRIPPLLVVGDVTIHGFDPDAIEAALER